MHDLLVNSVIPAPLARRGGFPAPAIDIRESTAQRSYASPSRDDGSPYRFHRALLEVQRTVNQGHEVEECEILGKLDDRPLRRSHCDTGPHRAMTSSDVAPPDVCAATIVMWRVVVGHRDDRNDDSFGELPPTKGRRRQVGEDRVAGECEADGPAAFPQIRHIARVHKHLMRRRCQLPEEVPPRTCTGRRPIDERIHTQEAQPIRPTIPVSQHNRWKTFLRPELVD